MHQPVSSQASIHRTRGDNKFVESTWLPSREALPASDTAWDAASSKSSEIPTSPSEAAIATNRWRKSRFESAPSALATLPFVNEEVLVVTLYEPGRRYIVEANAATSAPYGDKIGVFFRRGRG